MKVDGRVCHDLLAQKITQKLGFSEERDYAQWKQELNAKFRELMGFDQIEANAVENPELVIEAEVQKDGYKQIRCLFDSEVDATVVFYILIPDDLKKGEKRPMVITLQGHSTGVHNALGEPHEDADAEYALAEGKFAVQSVKEGYITVAIENRGMGERSATCEYNAEGKKIRNVWTGGKPSCYYEQMTGVLMARPILAERCFDTSKTIDMMLKHYGDMIDEKKIVITGNSGGGTVSYYMACYDERIALAVPSCAFCPYPESILKFYHCSCNYIPFAFKWWDMQDLSALIAPRRLVLVNGEQDPSFLADGVRRGYETVKKVYEKAGAPENCKSIIHEDGHYWRVDIIWPTIKEELAKIK